MKATWWERPFTAGFLILGIIGLTYLVLVTVLAIHSQPHALRDSCKSNLEQIGEAMAAYREDNGGCFPFSWQKSGEPEPEGNGAANAAMAATSLGNLYSRYIESAKIFRCPCTEDKPSFVLNLPQEFRGAGMADATLGALLRRSNWTLTSNLAVSMMNTNIRASSYGCDPRISPRAPGSDVVAADWDGSCQVNPDTATQNHDGGQNVLFVDGHAAWKTSNFCSTNPNDNIFVENNWDADTDTFLVNMDAGLGASFDGYKHLHYPRKP